MKFTLPSFEKNKFQRDTLKVPHFLLLKHNFLFLPNNRLAYSLEHPPCYILQQQACLSLSASIAIDSLLYHLDLESIKSLNLIT